MERGEGVRRVPDGDWDQGIVEAWERDCEEPDLRHVRAVRFDDDEWPWEVVASVMEFVREEPLESELREAMVSALSSVPLVTAVVRQDREVWIVGGAPSGEALVTAAAAVVDRFLDRTRTAMLGGLADGPAGDPSRIGPIARLPYGDVQRRAFGMLVEGRDPSWIAEQLGMDVDDVVRLRDHDV